MRYDKLVAITSLLIIHITFIHAMEDHILVYIEDNCLFVSGNHSEGGGYDLSLEEQNKLDGLCSISTPPDSDMVDLFEKRSLHPLPTDSEDKQWSLIEQRWHSRLMIPNQGFAGLLPVDAHVKGLLFPPPQDLRKFVGVNQGYRPKLQGTPDNFPYRTHELTKPYLVYAHGRFFSVFQNCMVAEHRAVQDYPFFAVVEYGYNTLYLHGLDAIPTLYSAGVDAHGRIWLTSREGWLAFFDAGKRSYLEGPTNQQSFPGALVARNNRSSSYFVPLDSGQGFAEIIVDFINGNAIAHPGAALLPSDVKMVLYSDDREIIYVTEKIELHKQNEVIGFELLVRRLTRDGAKGEDIFTEALGHDEHVYEGVYLPNAQKLFLLVGIPPVEGTAPFPDNSPGWKSLRLVSARIERN